MERSLSQRALDALHEHMRKRGDRRARRRRNRDEKYQVVKRQYRYDYTQGPMCFLGQQIVKMMQDAGYPSKIHCCYRPPDVQQKVFDEKRSKARPWRSPHQFLEAVDIVHADLYWNAPQDYWDHLAACVK